MLVFESHGALVADIGRTPILDRTGINISRVDGPGIAFGGEALEGSTVETHESLLDNGFHFTVTTFHIEHHGDGHTACKPLNGGLGEVAEAGNVTGNTGVDEPGGVETECIAIVGIEVGGSCAASFIAEEVVEGREFAVVLSGGTHFLEATAYHLAEKLLGLDERNLNVSVGVAVEGELTGYAKGQRSVNLGILLGEVVKNELALVFCRKFVEFGRFGQKVVELGYEVFHSGNELDETFGNQHGTEVVAVGSAGGNDAGHVINHVVEGHVLCLNLFGDDADVGLCLEGAFKSDVGSGAAHELDEVPVFLGREAVALDVADKLGVNLGGGVETEGGFYNVVLEVAVDSLGAAQNLNAGADAFVVFGENSGIGVGVVTADDYESGDAELLEDFKAFVELLFLFELGTARTDNVETACVAIFVDDIGSEFDVFVVNETAGAHEETVEAAVAVDFLDAVEETADHIVSAGSLSAGEDNAYIDGLAGNGVGIFLESELGKTVGVGEKFADFLLVGNGMGGFAFNSLDGAGESHGQFGLVGGAGYLQCAFLH